MVAVTDIAVDDEWERFEDLVALHTAGDVEEFRRRLVCYPAGPTNKSDSFEPLCLFKQFHENLPQGAATTAVLLVTDERWRSGAGRLMRHIDESGLIPSGELDLLAQTFLAAGPQVYWEAPGAWFGGPAITIDLGPHEDDTDDSDDSDGDLSPEDAADDGPVVVARQLRPPLRRWAAGRIVRAEPSAWGALIKRARDSDPTAGAAIMLGVLDGIDALTPAARASVAKLGTAWPQRAVRNTATAIINRPECDAASSPVAAEPGSKPPRDTAQGTLF